MTVRVEHGDSRDVLRTLADASVDATVCDPPYALVSIVKRFGSAGAAPVKAGKTGAYARASRGFMGKQWDTGDTAFDPGFWVEVLRVMKPGAHLIAFGGTRTYHRLACAIEDAGFEIRDMVSWLYGSGFPKSHNAGDGRGTALKPAQEPTVLARKPLIGTVAANLAAHGTGALNIDGCRVAGSIPTTTRGGHPIEHRVADSHKSAKNLGRLRPQGVVEGNQLGRWPANVIHDGSDEVLAAFPTETGNGRRVNPSATSEAGRVSLGRFEDGHVRGPRGHDDSGSAARFFYSAKATAADRLGSKHPTVKPVDLMRYLCRLVTPPGGTVLDPFAGSGTTGMACMAEGFDAILIEREAEYVADIHRRLAHVQGMDEGLFAPLRPDDDPDLFGSAAE